MALYDRYLAVDWSAAAAPRTGRDSIWIAETVRDGDRYRTIDPINPPTRTEAMAEIVQRLLLARQAGQRVLAGFDFAFGFPRGVAEALTGRSGWLALWDLLARSVEDGPDNRSNRYALADNFNRRLAHQSARFWGHPTQHVYENLLPTRPAFDAAHLPERRLVEHRHKGAKPIWQLAYAGSVGSQSILGIARLEGLRTLPELMGQLAIWPFETGFTHDLGKPIVIAEIYPALFDRSADPDPIPDRAQVRCVADALVRADIAGRLGTMLDAPVGLTSLERKSVLTEEGWIVGP